MLEDGRDYFPNLRNGKPYGAVHGLPDALMLYNYADNDKSIFTGGSKIVELPEGFDMKSFAYSLYDDNGLLYSVSKSQVKEIVIC